MAPPEPEVEHRTLSRGGANAGPVVYAQRQLPLFGLSGRFSEARETIYVDGVFGVLHFMLGLRLVYECGWQHLLRENLSNPS